MSAQLARRTEYLHGTRPNQRHCFECGDLFVDAELKETTDGPVCGDCATRCACGGRVVDPELCPVCEDCR